MCHRVTLQVGDDRWSMPVVLVALSPAQQRVPRAVPTQAVPAPGLLWIGGRALSPQGETADWS
ncbi:MAG: hypothetical protein ABR97_07000 [Rhodobacter sp. BACL10 MAG-120419-bin15]|nr:MAG: hypothetical protein ABR97_07000 [Rhodobacter sp. BACL10 MAG-120419-bin15]